jgi:TolB-like protein
MAGVTLRISARLIRADDGYVIWSETYDRPSDDVLRVQDDIAGEVTKALRAKPLE